RRARLLRARPASAVCTGTLSAADRRGDDPPRRVTAEILRIRPPLSRPGTDRRRRRILARARRGARPRATGLRRPSGDRRRDPGCRELLRPQHRWLSRPGRARHPGVRLSASRGILPWRARTVPVARARAGYFAALT